MSQFDKQPKFVIRPIIEQRPFESPAVQSFFQKWCEINDSIIPQIITRNEWEQKGIQNLLEKRSDNKQNLFIPDDLQLWEMVGIIEIVNADTFTTKPEQKSEAKEKMKELGKMFQNSAVYINQRLNSISQGRDIASALAQEFYSYGQSLEGINYSINNNTFDSFTRKKLTDEEIETVDRFLAGNTLYESRRKRVDSNNKDIHGREKERTETLAQFFRTTAKAFELNDPKEKSTGSAIKDWLKKKLENITERSVEIKKNDAWSQYQKFLDRDELSKIEQEERDSLEKVIFAHKPWSMPPVHSSFLDKVQKGIKHQIEIPSKDLEGSIFQRGMESLKKNMPFNKLPGSIKNSILSWENGEKTLHKALQVDKLKFELDTEKKSGNIIKIGEKEREVAKKIQAVVSGFQYKAHNDNPSEIISTQNINCVGASILGGTLMEEIGLNYLVATLPQHSTLLLITSDQHAEWYDMLTNYTTELTNEMIYSDKNAEKVTVKDIINFSKDSKSQVINFNVNSDDMATPISLLKPKNGQQFQLLNNTGRILIDMDQDGEAIEAFHQASLINDNHYMTHIGMGAALFNISRREKDQLEKKKYIDQSIGEFCKALRLNKKYINSYDLLSRALSSLNQDNKAIESYRRGLTFDSNNLDLHCGLANSYLKIGFKEEAVQEVEKIIELASKEKNTTAFLVLKSEFMQLLKKIGVDITKTKLAEVYIAKSREEIFNKEIQPENLITVRKFLDDIPFEFDKNGKIVCKQSRNHGRKRNTIHTTLNYPVESHRHGSWRDSNTIILSPYIEMIKENGKPVNVAWQDTFWWNEIKYPEKSIIITADDALQNKLDRKIYEVIYVPQLKDLSLEEKEVAFKKISLDEMSKHGYKIVEHDSLTGSTNIKYNKMLEDFAHKSGINFGIGSDNWTEKLDEYLRIDPDKEPKRAILEVVKMRFSYKKNKILRNVTPILKQKKQFEERGPGGSEILASEKREEVLEEYGKIENVKEMKYSIPIHVFEKIVQKLTLEEIKELLSLEEQGREKYSKKEIDIYPQFTAEERKILKEEASSAGVRRIKAVLE